MFWILAGAMVGRPHVEATAEEQEELRALAHSSDREDGRGRFYCRWRDGRAFGLPRRSPSRRTACDIGAGCLAANELPGFARKAPGPAPVKAPAVVETLLSQDVCERARWTLPRLQKAIAAPTGVGISTSRLSVVRRKKEAFAGGGTR
jgi:hypothetical protein